MSSRICIARRIYRPAGAFGRRAGLLARVDSRRVAAPSPTQLAWRGRIEAVLRVAGPALDLVLLAGDRISRLVDRDPDDEPPPAVPLTSTAAAPAVGPGHRATEPW
jgi:hypothetical protein